MDERPLFPVPDPPAACPDPWCRVLLARLAPLNPTLLRCEHGSDAESQPFSPEAAAAA